MLFKNAFAVGSCDAAFYVQNVDVIICDLGLRRPMTASHGHFGCDDIEFPWEKTDKAETLKNVSGL
jgi:S-adenosylmethionine synthetase